MKLINKFFEVGAQVVLLISSFYFFTFTLAFFFLQYLPNRKAGVLMVFLLSVLVMYLFFKFTPDHKEEKLLNIIKIGGSTIFLVFLVSSYFFGNSPVAQIFSLHSKFLQEIVNVLSTTIVSGIFVYAIGLLILYYIFVFFSKVVSFARKHSKLAGEILETVTVVAVFCLVFLFAMGRDFLFDKAVEVGSPFIIPILGFSVGYVHINFLIKKVFSKPETYPNVS